MPINLGIFASSMWMSLFFGLGTVVNIKKIREWPLIIKNSIIISQVLGAIFFLNIINENAITSRFFAIKTLFNRLYLGKKLYVIPTAGSCHPKLTASTWQMISIEK